MLGLSSLTSFMRASTSNATSISLAPDCLETCSMTQEMPLVLATAWGSCCSMKTSATSDRRMEPPVGREISVLATSSTDWNLASVDTERVLLPLSRSPPGYSRFWPARNWEI